MMKSILLAVFLASPAAALTRIQPWQIDASTGPFLFYTIQASSAISSDYFSANSGSRGFEICDGTYGTCRNKAVMRTANGNIIIGNDAPYGGSALGVVFMGSNDVGQMCLNQNGHLHIGNSCGGDTDAYDLNVQGVGRVYGDFLVGDLDIFTQSNLSVTGDSYFGKGGVSVSTMQTNGSLFLASGSSLTLRGANGYITTSSSVTASAFFGDGSSLSGISGTYLKLSGGALTGTITESYGISASTMILGGGSLPAGNVLAVTSMTATGLVHAGWERVVNSCGAGVTTCTASCTSGKYVTGGGCSVAAVLGVAVEIGDVGNDSSWTCAALTATTISATVYCARMAP